MAVFIFSKSSVSVRSKSNAERSYRRHPKSGSDEYADPELLKIIADNWPKILEPFELKGILPGNEMTTSEINHCRKLGVNTVFQMNGKVYMEPGLGITAAGTSLKIQNLLVGMREGVRQIST